MVLIFGPAYFYAVQGCRRHVLQEIRLCGDFLMMKQSGRYKLEPIDTKTII
jgi:hypothetical protein